MPDNNQKPAVEQAQTYSGARTGPLGSLLLFFGASLAIGAYCLHSYSAFQGVVDEYRLLPLQVAAVDDKVIHFTAYNTRPDQTFPATLLYTAGKRKPMMGDSFQALEVPGKGFEVCNADHQCFGVKDAEALHKLTLAMPTHKEVEAAADKLEAELAYKD
jgi:hypothetical protein